MGKGTATSKFRTTQCRHRENTEDRRYFYLFRVSLSPEARREWREIAPFMDVFTLFIIYLRLSGGVRSQARTRLWPQFPDKCEFTANLNDSPRCERVRIGSSDGKSGDSLNDFPRIRSGK